MTNKNLVQDRLVDVFIVDKNLAERILEKFPGLESKFNEDTSDGQQTVYGFLNLSREEYEAVKHILYGNKKEWEFEVRDSKTGEFIELNSFNIGFDNFSIEFCSHGNN